MTRDEVRTHSSVRRMVGNTMRVMEAIQRVSAAGRSVIVHHDRLVNAVQLPPVLQVQTDVGYLWAHRDDQVVRPYMETPGLWEPRLAALLRSRLRAGSTFLDVGANIGYFSVLAAQCMGPDGLVVAVEPDPGSVAVLRGNLWQHRCKNVVVLPVAAWMETTHRPFSVNDENRRVRNRGIV
jgi:hypothetical protein